MSRRSTTDLATRETDAERVPSAYLTSTERAYQRLRHAIVSGRYRPGDRLTEVALTQELGTSRTPVREAMRRLQGDGLLASARRGAIVPVLNAADVFQLYQMRAVLEALTAELAAERQRAGALASAAIRELHARELRFAEAVRARELAIMVRTNLALHRYVADLSANAWVREALQRIWDIIALSSITNLGDHAWARRVVSQHRALVRWITQGNARMAAAAARRHVLEAAMLCMSRAAREGQDVRAPADGFASRS